VPAVRSTSKLEPVARRRRAMDLCGSSESARGDSADRAAFLMLGLREWVAHAAAAPCRRLAA
jgi:hypothetical protein